MTVAGMQDYDLAQVPTVRSYDDLLSRLACAARSPYVGVAYAGSFRAFGREYPIPVVHLGTPGPGKLNVLISAGIHGDEPAGVEATLRFIEINAENPLLLSHYSFTIFPCENPYGWERDLRENAQGLDLNRQFVSRNPSPEISTIMKAMEGKSFDLSYEMHEDYDSPGFYLYEFGDDPEHYVGEAVVQEVASVGYPLYKSHVIEGRRARNGIIRVNMRYYRRTRLPKHCFAYRQFGGQVLTLETPSSALPLEDRVRIQMLGLRVSLERAWMRKGVPVGGPSEAR